MSTKSDRVSPGAPLVPGVKQPLANEPDEPPVVARLMIEIRSDGTRTIARGAMEDLVGGEKVALEARGTSPTALAASLVRSLFSAPLLAKAVARRLLRGR